MAAAYWSLKLDNVLDHLGLIKTIYGMEKCNASDSMFCVWPGQCNVVRCIKIGKMTEGTLEDLQKRILNELT